MSFLLKEDEESQASSTGKRESLDSQSVPYYDVLDPRQHRLKRTYQTSWSCIKLAIAFIAGVSCTLLSLKLGPPWAISRGQTFYKDAKDMSTLLPPGSVKVPFMYDARFPGPPTPESEQEWLNLLPNGLGFVQHDALGLGIVDFAAFHQLHCLMALRHAVYDSWNETQHSHMTPHHVRHCLEYLRQSIMCHADANTERRITFEDGSKSAPGWEEKKCKNYDALKAWAEEWRVWNGKIPSLREEITDPEVLKGRIIHY